MHYLTRKGEVKAVDDVTFTLYKGEALGLVGESGCGKTSIAITMLRLLPENAIFKKGHVFFYRPYDPQKALRYLGFPVKIIQNGNEAYSGRLREVRGDGHLLLQVRSNGHLKEMPVEVAPKALLGVDLVALDEPRLQEIRWKGISMIFQAAMNALNPVYKVGDQIAEAINTHMPGLPPNEVRDKIAQLFQTVGIDPSMMDRYPHEYSGGMKQRAIIAMALACDPDLIIADEPTTALDVIVQDKILREMRAIQKKLNMSMIYISHDIAVIAEVSDKIGVMYAGKLVELASAEAIFQRPVHPYTKALMSAFPSIKGEKRKLESLPGEPPDLIHPPSGCRFHPRCPYATEHCTKEDPAFKPHRDSHFAACWHPLS
ncbi:MAG: ABC transporter ATP-binding protein [Candidatus Bipolaricaulota bacterium]|nr:ABC transporter ATP-binding protein [Candidatus Bipolaricaulota bacterium]MCS7275101.1 ABC transporter ATP-binding protein [Candidatus Bipolaricaulota bacterium]